MEAVIICIDNSEWTRNGDYAPNRFQAQADAVNLLAGAKTEANSENTVGVITMSGKTPRVLVTLTTDLGKILNSVQVNQCVTLAAFSNPDCISDRFVKHFWSSETSSLLSLQMVSSIAEHGDRRSFKHCQVSSNRAISPQTQTKQEPEAATGALRWQSYSGEEGIELKRYRNQELQAFKQDGNACQSTTR